ncbi:NAD(P)-dependent alcohol dehydrogenase [Pseudonocardia sp.]|uniref:NAD(P)-dependent alcohol dehydrogenase n=1 Tax=Pseudonocardia sp. TaxID=60912 RepID=UPI003D104D0B
MTAVVQDRYGEAEEVLRVVQVPRPVPGPGEVLVQVQAAGLDRGAWHLMAGVPYPVRFAGFGVTAPRDPVRGRELAGRVVATGQDVAHLRTGDEVFGIAEGAFAEYATARADLLVPRPPGVTPVQAAATPISGLTALQAVRRHGEVRAGQEVLVLGASGGVGSFAVQIAKADGARVTGTASTAKLDVVRAVGADAVVDHSREDVTGRFDVVIDNGGHRSLRALRRLLTREGTLVIVGSETGGRWMGGLDRTLRALLLSPFVRHRLRSFVSPENRRDLETLADLLASGRVVPYVEETYPLTATATAMARLRDGRVRGKAVVEIIRET